MPNTTDVPGRQGLPRRYAVVGPDRHGVVAHGLRLAAADPRLSGTLLRVRSRTSGLRPQGLVTATHAGSAVMLQVTDRLLGSSPEAAALLVAGLARRARLALALHDIPQPAEGGSWYRRRRDAYAAMTGTASVVILASDHERDCLERCRHEANGTSAGAARVIVVPLPVEPPGVETAPQRVQAGEVAVLGYLYPGKGVEDVVATAAVLRRAGRDVRVTCLGAPAEGHAEHASQLAAVAHGAGVPFRITGFVPEHHLRSRLRTVGVPVAPHRHISASGTINAWLEAGRRPVTLPSRYTRELADRLPGSLLIASDLKSGVITALDRPEGTWLGAGVVLGPSVADAARRHADVLDDLAREESFLAAGPTVIA